MNDKKVIVLGLSDNPRMHISFCRVEVNVVTKIYPL